MFRLVLADVRPDVGEVTTVGELALDPAAFALEGVAGVEDVADLQRPKTPGTA